MASSMMDIDSEPITDEVLKRMIASETPVPTATETETSEAAKPIPLKVRLSKQGSFATGFDLFSEEEQERRKARAERFKVPLVVPQAAALGVSAEDYERMEQRKRRFGLKPTVEVSAAPVMDASISDMMDMDAGNDEKEAVSLDPPRRWKTLHIYGSKLLVEKVSTGGVLKLFDGFGPESVEWLTDVRCNVNFVDDHSAKRALLTLSRPILGQRSFSSSEEHQYTPEMLELLLWREAKEHKQSSTLYFRIAHEKDVRYTRKPSEYYRQIFGERNQQSKRGGGKGRGKGRGMRDEKEEAAAADTTTTTTAAPIRDGRRERHRRDRRAKNEPYRVKSERQSGEDEVKEAGKGEGEQRAGGRRQQQRMPDWKKLDETLSPEEQERRRRRLARFGAVAQTEPAAAAEGGEEATSGVPAVEEGGFGTEEGGGGGVKEEGGGEQ